MTSVYSPPPLYDRADPNKIGSLYQPLRVADVSDALDAIGYFNIGRMNPEIRPMWDGARFWGEATTLRIVPAREPMWAVPDINTAMDEWFDKIGLVHPGPFDAPPGHVIVLDSGGAPETAFFGSEGSLRAVIAGAAGIVTDGWVRDNREIREQRSPIAGRYRGRTTLPGRIEILDVDRTIACGGVQVRPGDIVGADDDGVVVVPREVAEIVAKQARRMMFADVRHRAGLYGTLGLEMDESTDLAALQEYFGDVLEPDELPVASEAEISSLDDEAISARIAAIQPELVSETARQREAISSLLKIARAKPSAIPEVARTLRTLNATDLFRFNVFDFRPSDDPELLDVLDYWYKGANATGRNVLEPVIRALRQGNAPD